MCVSHADRVGGTVVASSALMPAISNVRHAFRALRNRPGLSDLAILILGLGIGATRPDLRRGRWARAGRAGGHDGGRLRLVA